MAGSAESGKEAGGLLRSIGRLMRRGRSKEEARADEARAEGSRSDEPAGEEVAGAPSASPTERPGEDQDELVLGPAQKAPSTPEEEDAEDELTLTTPPEGEEATGESAGATGAEPDEEAILARVRAAREGHDEDAADEPLTKAEDEWAASFGAAVTETTAEGAAGGATEESAAAEPASPGLSWRPPQDDDEEEGAGPASGPSPKAPETVEGEVMRPEGETEGDETEGDEAERDEAEVSAEAVPLFPTSRLAPDMNVREEEAEDRAAGKPDEGDAGTSEEETAGAERPEDDLATAEAPALVEGEAGEAEEEKREAEEPSAGAKQAEAVAAEEAEAGTADAGELRSRNEDRLGAEETSAEETGVEETGAEDPEAKETEAEAPEAEEPETRETQSEPGESGPDETAPAGGATIFPLAAAPAGDAAQAEGTPDDTAPEGGGLDERAVEEIVRRLIREEMEGELGQRLSGNIRRIVRDEVTRALLRQR